MHRASIEHRGSVVPGVPEGLSISIAIRCELYVPARVSRVLSPLVGCWLVMGTGPAGRCARKPQNTSQTGGAWAAQFVQTATAGPCGSCRRPRQGRWPVWDPASRSSLGDWPYMAANGEQATIRAVAARAVVAGDDQCRTTFADRAGLGRD